MELVNIQSVKPGQVLARAVLNADGAVLCPAGFRLTDAAIERLQRAGVEAVVLEGGSAQRELVEARLAELEKRFANVDDPLLLQIKAAAEKRLSYMLLG